MKKIKNYKIQLSIVLSILVIFFLGSNSISIAAQITDQELIEVNTYDKTTSLDQIQKMRYEKNVSGFNKIFSSQIDDFIGSNDIFIFWGRETCPYCRSFVPYLASAAKETKTKILYIDTDNLNNEDVNLDQMRQMYNITNVPSLIKITDKNTFVFYDTTKAGDGLENFLMNNDDE